MNKTSDFKNIEKAFYSDGYRLGMRAAEKFLSKESLQASISEMYVAIDTLIQSVDQLAIQQNKKIDCKKGCDFCCYQPVYALDYELQYLNAFIEQNFSDKNKIFIKVLANKNRENRSKLSHKEILNSKQPCPLLKNGSCSVYKVRPMACRIYLSTNVNSCKIFYKDPENKTSFPALLEFPMRAGRMMNEGFKSGLKMSGIKPEEFRIEEKILEI